MDFDIDFIVPDDFDLKRYESFSGELLLNWLLNLASRMKVMDLYHYEQIDESIKLNNFHLKHGQIGGLQGVNGSLICQEDLFDHQIMNYIEKSPESRKEFRESAGRICAFDLNYPDKILVEQFKKWIQQERKSRRIKPITYPSVAKLRRLHQHRVLPYLDLSHWMLLSGVKLTYGQIGMILFPDHRGGAHESLVRKNTIPAVKYVENLMTKQSLIGNFISMKNKNKRN